MLPEMQNQDKLSTSRRNFSSAALLWPWGLSPVRAWQLLNASSPVQHRKSLTRSPNGKGNLSVELLKEDLYSGFKSQLLYSSTLLLLLQLLLEKQLVIITSWVVVFGLVGFFFFWCNFFQLYRETEHPLYMYEIFILKYLLASSCKLLCLVLGVVAELESQVILSFGDARGVLFTSRVCGFMWWRRVSETGFFGQQSRMWGNHSGLSLFALC